MQEEILKLYEPQLQLKQVIVSIESVLLTVYVAGAVLRQGKFRVNARLPLEI